MKNKNIAQIQAIYKQLQQQFNVEQNSELLSSLTHFTTNDDLPIHRWFHFKEGFSADLMGALEINCEVLKNHDAVFVDPFCGSGTTILAGDIQYKWRARRLGFEVNPFLAFVSVTKANWRKYNLAKFKKLIKHTLEEPLRKDLPTTALPSLSTFHNPKIFSRRKVSQLTDLVSRVHKLKAKERDLLLLGIASAVEKLGFYRKDGRALRILRNEKEIRRRKALKVEDLVTGIWKEFEQDILCLESQKKSPTGKFEIFCSDGRIMLPKEKRLENGSVNLVAYSPPYLNHIDYTEVYKIELWLLGFLKTADQMKDLRKRTLRSHGSYSFNVVNNRLPKQISSILNLLADEIEKTGTTWHKHFRNVAIGYFEDMWISLRRQYELLRPGCQSICVVANSAHGSKNHRVPIAVDLLISILAKEVGFEVSKIVVARRMSRRDTLNVYLRESIIIMKKPSE